MNVGFVMPPFLIYSFSPPGPTSAPRAGSSRELVAAEPAVATRTNLCLCFPCKLIQIKDRLYKMICLFVFYWTTYSPLQKKSITDIFLGSHGVKAEDAMLVNITG